jgi:hypothetical protein
MNLGNTVSRENDDDGLQEERHSYATLRINA